MKDTYSLTEKEQNLYNKGLYGLDAKKGDIFFMKKEPNYIPPLEPLIKECLSSWDKRRHKSISLVGENNVLQIPETEFYKKALSCFDEEDVVVKAD